MNGVKRIVKRRSRWLLMLRADITAGTVQPKPIIMGIKLRPFSPILRRGLSMRNAARAMYPLSSRMDRHMNRMTMVGMKLSTLPTPVSTPFTTRSCTQPATSLALSHWAIALILASTSAENPSATHDPKGPKVIQNTSSMAQRNTGMANTGCVSTRSTRSERETVFSGDCLRITALASSFSMYV